MKKLLYLFIFFILFNCSSSKGVFWCGDHPCINKKEKEAYFKKTMIVEIRELDKTNNNNKTELEKIIQNAKNEEKRRLKEEKDLTKQAKLDEKRRLEEEKNLAKKIERDVKKIIKKEKVLPKNNVDSISASKDNKIYSGKFNELAQQIIQKNTFRPYPDINDMPN